MNSRILVQNLIKAASAERDSISDDNLFKTIGFDGKNERLGWVRPPEWEDVEDALKVFLRKAKGKREFIFVGMGGSINGIKTLIKLSGVKNIHALDSLDPVAIEAVLNKIADINFTLVIPISKSGTTKETQLIAETLRDVFGESYADNFLWFADPESFDKLNMLGWEKIEKIAIQVNKKNDVGGRFSSPHTVVFLAPLILIFNGRLGRLREVWQEYAARQDELCLKAAEEASRYFNVRDFRLLVEVRRDILEGFANWIIQLFQESLGSKSENFFIKTLVGEYGKTLPGFTNISIPDECCDDSYVYIMNYMYFLQVFTALFAYCKNINFVNQPYVEVYKKELKNLGDKEIEKPEKIAIDTIEDAVGKYIKAEHEFIDCILFFAASDDTIKALKTVLSEKFPQKNVSVFIGSDWNHHSYQAAFSDKKTLFLIFDVVRHKETFQRISAENSKRNIKTLKAIGYATYKTLCEKAIYLCLSL